MVEGGRKEKPSAALARTRPVFRGLRFSLWSRANPPGPPPPCKDETRFQGIAIAGPLGPGPVAYTAILQGRDPFSGDCDQRSWPPPQHHKGGRLQGRDPFSGDCDPGGWPPLPTPGSHLQGRDPFSGDCDTEIFAFMFILPQSITCKDETRFQGIAMAYRRAPAWPLRARPLQGRDPFSGDCDRL